MENFVKTCTLFCFNELGIFSGSMSWPIFDVGDFVFVKMRRSRFYSLETLWPAVVIKVISVRGVNLYNVHLYRGKGIMEYVSVLQMRVPTDDIMEWGSLTDYELRAAILELKKDMW